MRSEHNDGGRHGRSGGDFDDSASDKPRVGDGERGFSAPESVDPTGQASGAPPADTGNATAADGGSQELAEQRDRYLRLAAEYDNFRKRTARERNDIVARSQADVVRPLLDALDDLGRFAHLDPAVTDCATVVEGAAMVERKLLKVLSAAGLEAVNPIDQTFDPTDQEAVATEPALSREDDHVVSKVYQQGYKFNGQLLRPARVVVKQWNG
jgi:molecular chaperone GrpE